jgi:hypothetical protein
MIPSRELQPADFASGAEPLGAALCPAVEKSANSWPVLSHTDGAKEEKNLDKSGSAFLIP